MLLQQNKIFCSKILVNIHRRLISESARNWISTKIHLIEMSEEEIEEASFETRPVKANAQKAEGEQATLEFH